MGLSTKIVKTETIHQRNIVKTSHKLYLLSVLFLSKKTKQNKAKLLNVLFFFFCISFGALTFLQNI